MVNEELEERVSDALLEAHNEFYDNMDTSLEVRLSIVAVICDEEGNPERQIVIREDDTDD